MEDLVVTPPDGSPAPAQPPCPAVPRGKGAPLLRALLVPLLAWLTTGLGAVGVLVAWSTLRNPEGGVAGASLSAQLFASAVGYVPALVLVAWLWRRLDELPLPALGYAPPAGRALRGLALGAALGVAAMALVVAVGWAAGGYGLTPGDLASGLLAQLTWGPVIVLAAHFEEVLFRGYVLQNTGRRSVALGVGASSVFFALVHLSNPNALDHGLLLAGLSVLNIVLAGVWLATVYLRSGDLWWPTGAHVGWNWAQGLLFGLPVSGLELPGFLRGWTVHDASPVFGGPFGPESSLLATALLALLIAEGAAALRRRTLRLPLQAVWEAQAAAKAGSEVTCPERPAPPHGKEGPP